MAPAIVPGAVDLVVVANCCPSTRLYIGNLSRHAPFANKLQLYVLIAHFQWPGQWQYEPGCGNQRCNPEHVKTALPEMVVGLRVPSEGAQFRGPVAPGNSKAATFSTLWTLALRNRKKQKKTMWPKLPINLGFYCMLFFYINRRPRRRRSELCAFGVFPS